jgi:L-histidine N-alpha-methyltransferase
VLVTSDSAALGTFVEGLKEPQKRVDPKYFYDQRGSELFDEITTLEEYYPTRTELALLERYAGEIVGRTSPAALLELGAGSARKTRLLLRALEAARPGATYAPVDVSADFLADTARELRVEFPELRIAPHAADFTEPIRLANPLPRPVLVAFLGSTIGNFSRRRSVELIEGLAASMDEDDHILLGADLRPGGGKSVAELEAAYNDARGVTAAFNLNILSSLNDRFGTDFDVDRFEHEAFYDEERHRIEMHLRARSAHRVTLPDGTAIEFQAGETLLTEISRKYDRDSVERLFSGAGLTLVEWFDAEGRYGLALARKGGG